MPYGLPSMKILAEEIEKSTTVQNDPSYMQFCQGLRDHGLERAIDSLDLLQDTKKEIRKIVWETVNEKDLSYFDQNRLNAPSALVGLIEKIISTASNKIDIVTTNYDRLADYAIDKVGATPITGFEGRFIRKLELPSASVTRKRIHAREKLVYLWKVHGSLDWFKSFDDTIVEFSHTREIPQNFYPLIIPPGKEKYSGTHEEPFRTIIAEADKAFVQARSYLCVGYGFNDEHVQPKLLEQIAQKKPIVILARTMTEACKKHIIDSKVKKFLIFEKDGCSTKVYGNGWVERYPGEYWQLENFLSIW